MPNLAKDTAFTGLEKSFPEEMQGGVKELVRRLERFSNSLIYRLRDQVTVYRDAITDPPTGMKAGDLWTTPTNYVYRFDGISWIQLLP